MSRFCIAREYFHDIYYMLPIEFSESFLKFREFERTSNGGEDRNEIYKKFYQYKLKTDVTKITFTDPINYDDTMILSDEYLK